MRSSSVSFVVLRTMREIIAAGEVGTHGHRVIATIRGKSGAVYPVLHRLRDAGWIESAGELHHYDRPTSILYRATDLGRASFHELISLLELPAKGKANDEHESADRSGGDAGSVGRGNAALGG